MLYRDVQHAVDAMDRIHVPLRQAILAGSTQEMGERAREAQAAADQVLLGVELGLQRTARSLETRTSDGRIERFFVQAAVDALQRAITRAQGALLGSDVLSVRSRLLEFKTQVDFADAYMRAAIGQGETAEAGAA